MTPPTNGPVLTPLGCMGWIPAGNRHTCCYCLEYGGQLIILDAGTGLARLTQPKYQPTLKKYDSVLILLSHYHLDHVAGLIYLSHFFRHHRVHVAAPGRDIYGKPARDILDQLITPPYFGRTFSDFPMNPVIHDLGTGTTEINGIRLTTRLQPHTDPSLGFNIDGQVSYITDTTYCEDTVDFVRGSRLLLHEAWFDDQEYNEWMDKWMKKSPASPAARKYLDSHTAATGAARIAARANVQHLMLIHHNPDYHQTRLNRMEKSAKKIFAPSSLAREEKAFIVPTTLP